MRVELCRNEPFGGHYVYQWLRKHIGDMKNGWTTKIEVIESGNSRIHRVYIEIDNELDALAYKLRFKL